MRASSSLPASEGFARRVSPGEVDSAFEVPLAFLMAPQNYERQQAHWNQLSTSVSAIQFEQDRIWGLTAGILRNLCERIYKD